MKRTLTLLLLAASLVLAGCFVLGGCNNPEKPALQCQWSIITIQGGISVVQDGNPAEKSVKDLLESGVGFSQKIEREMVCRPSGNISFITNPPSTPTQGQTEGTWAYNISE